MQGGLDSLSSGTNEMPVFIIPEWLQQRKIFKTDLPEIFSFSSPDRVGEKVGEKLTANQEKILLQLSQNENLSARELAELVGISSRKIEQNIARLKNLGRLRRIGPAKGGYWEVVE